MFEELGLVVLLLPIGFALGWAVARSRAGVAGDQAAAPGEDSLAGPGPNYAEDADRSLASVLDSMPLNESTVELHLSLGTVFRKRGEVDRALHLHQHLLAQDGLATPHRQRVHLELAYDYQKAGLLDHAEKLFGQLVDEGLFQTECLQALVAIYEQEHDWDKAIAAARRLQSVRGESLHDVIAHYHCEMAELARGEGDLRRAEALAEQALAESRGSVRASFVLGAVREALENPRAAIGAYRRVPDQDLRFFGDVMPAIERAYRKAKDLPGLRRYLAEAEKDYPTAVPSVAMARLMKETGEDPAQFLAERMSQRPSWTGLHALLSEVEGLGEPVRVLRAAIESSLQGTPRYRCSRCGLTPRYLFWQCPSCKHWGSVEPVPDDIRSTSA